MKGEYEVVTKSGRVYGVPANRWDVLAGNNVLVFRLDEKYVRAFVLENVETWDDGSIR